MVEILLVTPNLDPMLGCGRFTTRAGQRFAHDSDRLTSPLRSFKVRRVYSNTTLPILVYERELDRLCLKRLQLHGSLRPTPPGECPIDYWFSHGPAAVPSWRRTVRS